MLVENLETLVGVCEMSNEWNLSFSSDSATVDRLSSSHSLDDILFV